MAPEILSAEQELLNRAAPLHVQLTADGIATLWYAADDVSAVLRYLKTEISRPYRMLYDLTCIDERERRARQPVDQ